MTRSYNPPTRARSSRRAAQASPGNAWRGSADLVPFSMFLAATDCRQVNWGGAVAVQVHQSAKRLDHDMPMQGVDQPVRKVVLKQQHVGVDPQDRFVTIRQAVDREVQQVFLGEQASLRIDVETVDARPVGNLPPAVERSFGDEQIEPDGRILSGECVDATASRHAAMRIEMTRHGGDVAHHRVVGKQRKVLFDVKRSRLAAFHFVSRTRLFRRRPVPGACDVFAYESTL